MIRFIDSHTEGEPTRVIVEGGPDLGPGDLAEQAQVFARHADDFRQAVILEPRGSDALVGALLCEPSDPSCAAGVIYFNNKSTLQMCGHGTIGLIVTLAHLGRIETGTHRIDTPVGIVTATLLEGNEVAIENVPSYRHRSQVPVEVPDLGTVVGDIAWGGNWFFLVGQSPLPLTLEHERHLTIAAEKIMAALRKQGITGANAGEIDHIEFFGPPADPAANSRNFVYCPGGAYDRSPCGTGTSAKLACLAADGKLKPGEPWVQESIIGSRFVGIYQPQADGRIIPTIRGRAFVCAQGELIQQPADPYINGIT